MTLRDLLIKHEGTGRKRGGRFFPYEDSVWKLTLGYGRNLEDIGISEEEAGVLLDNDIARVVAECRRSFGWFDGLDEVRQHVIISMVFNVGRPGFLGFKKMISAIEKSDWQMAAIEMLDSKWSEQVGRRATELAQMMKTGEDSKE